MKNITTAIVSFALGVLSMYVTNDIQLLCSLFLYSLCVLYLSLNLFLAIFSLFELPRIGTTNVAIIKSFIKVLLFGTVIALYYKLFKK